MKPKTNEPIDRATSRAIIHRYLFAEGIFARIASRDLSIPPIVDCPPEKLRTLSGAEFLKRWIDYATGLATAAIDDFACGVDCASFTFSMGHAAMAGAQSRGLDMRSLVPLTPPDVPNADDLRAIVREHQIAKTRDAWLDFEPRLLRLVRALESGKDP